VRHCVFSWCKISLLQYIWSMVQVQRNVIYYLLCRFCIDYTWDKFFRRDSKNAGERRLISSLLETKEKANCIVINRIANATIFINRDIIKAFRILFYCWSRKACCFTKTSGTSISRYLHTFATKWVQLFSTMS